MSVFVGDISGAPLFGAVLLVVALSFAASRGVRHRRQRQDRERQRRAFWGFE
jgi:hypothetical protein